MDSYEVFQYCKKKYEPQINICKCGSHPYFLHDIDTKEYYIYCLDCHKRTINKKSWKDLPDWIESYQDQTEYNFKLALDCWNGKEIKDMFIGYAGEELL